MTFSDSSRGGRMPTPRQGSLKVLGRGEKKVSSACNSRVHQLSFGLPFCPQAASKVLERYSTATPYQTSRSYALPIGAGLAGEVKGVLPWFPGTEDDVQGEDLVG